MNTLFSIKSTNDDFILDITVDQYHRDSLVIRDINGNMILLLEVNMDDNLEAVVTDMNNKKHTIEIRGMNS